MHPAMRNMIGTVKEVTKFSSSNKKQIILQKAMELSTSASSRVTLPGLSETRWVGRIITSLENFVSCYVPIVRALMAIHKWSDSDASVKATLLAKSGTSTSFLVASPAEHSSCYSCVHSHARTYFPSIVRLLKTYLRNRSSESRLNGLALMYFNSATAVDMQDVI